MNVKIEKYELPITLSLLVLLVFSFGVSAQSMQDYTSQPPSMAETSSPLVMMVMSQDNQLWHKAYNDYSDLNADGIIDTTYDDRIDYYGYFVSDYCYEYSEGKGGEFTEFFQPQSKVNDNLLENGHKCSGLWSGNFLNWLTTTRIDVIRKVLYGGYRIGNTESGTLLQRAMIPSDNHAFVKLVSNDTLPVGSIADFTPILGQEALSFCNVTDVPASDSYGNNGTPSDYFSGLIDVASYPPKLKVAAGLWPTWAGSALRQCQFRGHDNAPDIGGEQGSYSYSPARGAANGIQGITSDQELNVRVEVCVDGVNHMDGEHCREYVSTESGSPGYRYKPYGLLQTYGETGDFQFGLLTGTYDKNHEGGVVRKNIAFMGGEAAEADKEIDIATGEFIVRDNGRGIINTLNHLRVAGWNYTKADYRDCEDPGISVDAFLAETTGTACKDWGNPISEMYIEALRYFAGDPLTQAYQPNSASKTILDPLSQENSWADPLAGTPCSHCAIILLSTGLNSFDSDTLGNLNGLPGLLSTTAGNYAGLDAYTHSIGDNEEINGGSFIVGQVGPSNTGTTGTEGECDAKTVDSLSNVSGICPEIPTLRGSFNVAGAAFYARKNDLRLDLDGKQSVETYAISLAESLPSFEIPVAAAPSPAGGSEVAQSVTVVPTCRSHSNRDTMPVPQPLSDGGIRGPWRECSLVDLTVEAQTETYGRIKIAWEDSPWGNDYDMDAYSVIEYCSAHGSEANVQASCEDFTEQANSYYGLSQTQAQSLGGQLPAEFDSENAKEWAPENDYDYSQHNAFPEWQGALPGEIQVRVAMIGASAGFAMKFGYTMNGADTALFGSGLYDDGAYVNEVLRYGNYDGNSSALTGSREHYVIWSSGAKKFKAAQSTPKQLENPLWYAAKYGGFSDLDNDGFPVDATEWDTTDLYGNYVAGGDGIPDTYFPVKNLASLPIAMSEIFQKIDGLVAAGSAASVNAQTGRGEGVIFQASYTPELEGIENSVKWFGNLEAFFVDRFGQIREDGNGNKQLDDGLEGDRALEFFFDESSGQTKVLAFQVDENGEKTSPETPSDVFDISSDQLRPIWSAHDQLNEMVHGFNEPADQLVKNEALADNRAYEENAANGRYIFTAIESTDTDIHVIPPLGANENQTDTVIAFTAENFPVNGTDKNSNEYSNNYRHLGLTDTNSVEPLINFIRGVEGQPGLRRRSLGDEQYLIGDIINSTPVSVSKPADRYDLLYQDDSYKDYYQAHIARRNVVYVGANDGMLHAYNGGFFNPESMKFGLGENVVPHPLGAELWAYVPYNVLPHLQWLTAPQYQHVNYVDGSVKQYDVRIYDPAISSGPNINGWATIIVASLRFGGGDFFLGQVNGTDFPPVTTRSAHIVLDVTDPEAPPKLLAEITDEDLGYTSASPVLVKRSKNTDEVNTNDWYLLFASGPAGIDTLSRRRALSDAVSAKPAKIYAFNLVDRTMEFESQLIAEHPEFVGGMVAVDWNRDYQDDAVYFGTVSGTPDSPNGALKRGKLNFTPSGLFGVDIANFYSKTDRAFSAAPITYRDGRDYWVFAGTGRFYVDKDMTSMQQQYFYGIKEPRDQNGLVSLDGTVSDTALVDTTEIDVFSDGRVFNNRSGTVPALLSGGQVPEDGEPNDSPETFYDIQDFVAVNGGWKFAFRNPFDPDNTSDDSDPERIRVHNRAAVAGESLVITAYQGAPQVCDATGRGFLYSPHATTGVAAPFAPLGTDPDDTISSIGDEPELNEERVLTGVDLGIGVSSEPVVLRPAGGRVDDEQPGCDPTIAYTQGSLADIDSTTIACNNVPPGRKGWREIPMNW